MMRYQRKLKTEDESSVTRRRLLVQIIKGEGLFYEEHIHLGGEDCFLKCMARCSRKQWPTAVIYRTFNPIYLLFKAYTYVSAFNGESSNYHLFRRQRCESASSFPTQFPCFSASSSSYHVIINIIPAIIIPLIHFGRHH